MAAGVLQNFNGVNGAVTPDKYRSACERIMVSSGQVVFDCRWCEFVPAMHVREDCGNVSAANLRQRLHICSVVGEIDNSDSNVNVF